MTDKLDQASGADSRESAPLSRSGLVKAVLAICAVVLFTGFTALGTWQLYRLQWKLDLIERVDQRVFAAPVAPPSAVAWPQVNAHNDEYRHVRVAGTFLHKLSAKTQAVTDLGPGFWLMTPLRMDDGSVVLINRGFITDEQGRSTATPIKDQEPAVVTGLLRLSEPGGGFLRQNNPAEDRWHSRDVQAIAAARGLTNVAPYFIDAEANPVIGTGTATETPPAATSAIQPVAGLTVIAFHNSHLVYALTWYALALMVAGAAYWVRREERKAAR